MNTEGFRRKLTAVFSADVVGYSRLMGEDEAATVKTLETYKGVMFSLIKQHRGAVVDSPGDNLLAEFGSVVDAVQCAVSIQKELQTRNADLPENRRMAFRIGINLGDVIEEDDRIYGDGVNIAARLEALADPGGICVSKTDFDHIESKLPLGYEFLGEQTVKNIPRPIGAYRVLMEPRVTAAKGVEEKKAIPFWRRRAALSVGITLILAIVAVLYWNFYLRGPSIEPASVERMAYPLPDKPSIAVLPFTNMSGDPEQEYIGDGLSENIISALSVSSKMFVMSRSATFTYKEKPVKPQQVAEDLGVQYVLEGSIVKSGDRLRVTAQLIDALAGHHLWAEVYDREMRDLFELQDEITKKIVVSIGVELVSGEDLRLAAKSTDNLEAWKRYIKGAELFFKNNAEDNAKAREYLEAALDLDPEHDVAIGVLAATHLVDGIYGWSDSPLTSMNRAYELAQKAVELNEQSGGAHMIMGLIFLYQRQHEKAIFEGKRAITLNPNYAYGHIMLAGAMYYSGRFDEAITLTKKAFRLNPYLRPRYLESLVRSYIFLGRYEEALEICNQLEEGAEKAFLYSWIYQELGREEEARAYMAEGLKMQPDRSLEFFKSAFPFENPAHLQRVLDAYRKAGMPEKAPGTVQEKSSIAVLPFDNLSPDPDQAYFADGIAEELLNSLTRISELEVRGRTSSFYFKDRDEDLPTISKMLNVEYILEGSVRKAGEQVRITVQLINTRKDAHIWSETYERTMDDIFAIQDDIAQSVADALQITLGVGELGRAPGMTSNIAAYDAFLAGRSLWLQPGRENISQAIEQLEQAVALDPDFAIGWRALAFAYRQAVAWIPERGEEFVVKREAAHSRVIELTPETDFAHVIAASRSGDRVEVERLYKRALALAPANYDTNFEYAWFLNCMGRPTEAIDYIQRLVRMEPLASGPYLGLGITYELSGNSDAATMAMKKARDLSNDPTFYNSSLLVLALEENNRALIDEYSALTQDPVMHTLLDTPEQAGDELRLLLADPAYNNPINLTGIAVWASYFGEFELALQVSREAIRSNYYNVWTIWRPIHKEMRQIPGFKDFVRELGLVDYWRTSGNWGDFCHPVGEDDFECD
jgi:adenylate cyclase